MWSGAGGSVVRGGRRFMGTKTGAAGLGMLLWVRGGERLGGMDPLAFRGRAWGAEGGHALGSRPGGTLASGGGLAHTGVVGIGVAPSVMGGAAVPGGGRATGASPVMGPSLGLTGGAVEEAPAFGAAQRVRGWEGGGAVASGASKVRGGAEVASGFGRVVGMGKIGIRGGDEGDSAAAHGGTPPPCRGSFPAKLGARPV